MDETIPPWAIAHRMILAKLIAALPIGAPPEARQKYAMELLVELEASMRTELRGDVLDAALAETDGIVSMAMITVAGI